LIYKLIRRKPKTEMNEIIREINEFITAFKGTDDLSGVYRKFNSDWLSFFKDVSLIEDVKVNYDCVRYERIYGCDDEENARMVMDDFIASMETLIK